MENETCQKIKCLKSDNEDEYNTKKFDDYCDEYAIKTLKTIPETPQQNGVVER